MVSSNMITAFTYSTIPGVVTSASRYALRLFAVDSMPTQRSALCNCHSHLLEASAIISSILERIALDDGSKSLHDVLSLHAGRLRESVQQALVLEIAAL